MIKQIPFIFYVTQLVPDDQLDPDDTGDDNPVGAHKIEACDAESAADQFHLTVPIACLDDFDIEQAIDYKEVATRLDRYTMHNSKCTPINGPCVCGLDDLRHMLTMKV